MFDTISKPYIIQKDFVHSFEEQLELFFAKDFETIIEKPKADENLGQVFTSPILAEFMINLLAKDAIKTSSILDPCIGPNTFFKALPEKISNCYLKGIEIDENLITAETLNFYEKPNRELSNGSFFNLPIDEKFDLIIQNPPYVRQELLANGVNSKSNIKSKISSNLAGIPSQSNLYIYFLLKAILHLKKDGIMVAVIYDSWLYSSFGNFLKESFLKLGYLENIYHFKKSAFDDAEVGATVIKFVKKNDSKKSISYYALTDLTDLKNYRNFKHVSFNIKQNELLKFSFNNSNLLNTNTQLFKSIHNISKEPIQRGTSAIVNSHFIFSENVYPELTPIIKDVSRVKTYTAPKENAFILSVNKAISEKTKIYLSSVKQQIINTPSNKYKAVKRDIELNNSWYKIKIKSTGNFIFNYYLRNNIDFIYNPEKKLSSDNFYSINIENHELCYLAILNSSLTKLSVLNNSRSQGNGLRKIQLYEFKEISIIDAEKLSTESIKQLEQLGKTLMSLNRYKNEQLYVIEKIDSILLKEYNNYNNSSISIEELKNKLKEYIK